MSNTKMTCPLLSANEDVLLDYCARALDAERTAMLEAHMAHCADCREMAKAQAEVWAAMDLYEAEEVSSDFDRRLYARIEAEVERVTAWERFWAPVREYLRGQPAWKPVVSVAAASAVLVLVFLVRANGPSVEPAQGLDVAEVEQAERVLEDMEMLRQLDAPVPEPVVQKDVL